MELGYKWYEQYKAMQKKLLFPVECLKNWQLFGSYKYNMHRGNDQEQNVTEIGFKMNCRKKIRHICQNDDANLQYLVAEISKEAKSVHLHDI